MISTLPLPPTTGRDPDGPDARLAPDSLQSLVEDLAARPELWRGRVRHSGERESDLLWRDDRVEVWLICWNGERHDTGFHDHDISAGAFAVVEGALSEERLTIGATSRRHLSQGQSTSFPPSYVHRVSGVGSLQSVSIHAYSPPLRRLGVYAVTEHGALARESVSAGHELTADPARATHGIEVIA